MADTDAFERESDKMELPLCWLCGEHKKTTIHHAIPVAMKPVYNKGVPICVDCHIKVNEFYCDHFAKKNAKKITKMEVRITELEQKLEKIHAESDQ